MKRIYLIFVMLFILMFITSCSYNPPVGATEKHHTYEEVLEYAKKLDPNAIVNDEYEDTKLDNVAADEYREWNAIINGIECHVASTPIIVMNEGVAGGEFGKKYFIIDSDYNFYLLKSIIENSYPEFIILEEDISNRYYDSINLILANNDKDQLTQIELDDVWNKTYAIYQEYVLNSTSNKLSIRLYSPTVLCSNDGSNKHVEIKLNYYSINKDITKEDFINKYMNDWDNLNLGIPVE